MGAFLGHPVQIYMPDWLSEERKQLLRFYGAKLFEISAENGGFLKCIELADKKVKKWIFWTKTV
jgi:cysteine synthase A